MDLGYRQAAWTSRHPRCPVTPALCWTSNGTLSTMTSLPPPPMTARWDMEHSLSAHSVGVCSLSPLCWSVLSQPTLLECVPTLLECVLSAHSVGVCSLSHHSVTAVDPIVLYYALFVTVLDPVVLYCVLQAPIGCFVVFFTWHSI